MALERHCKKLFKALKENFELARNTGFSNGIYSLKSILVDNVSHDYIPKLKLKKWELPMDERNIIGVLAGDGYQIMVSGTGHGSKIVVASWANNVDSGVHGKKGMALVLVVAWGPNLGEVDVDWVRLEIDLASEYGLEQNLARRIKQQVHEQPLLVLGCWNCSSAEEVTSEDIMGLLMQPTKPLARILSMNQKLKAWTLGLLQRLPRVQIELHCFLPYGKEDALLVAK